MKLYVDRGGTAPSPRRVRIFLSEKGIEIPQERLEIHKENRTAAFREKNALSTLPVLGSRYGFEESSYSSTSPSSLRRRR
jgi:glutathione S-transferase